MYRRLTEQIINDIPNIEGYLPEELLFEAEDEEVESSPDKDVEIAEADEENTTGDEGEELDEEGDDSVMPNFNSEDGEEEDPIPGESAEIDDEEEVDPNDEGPATARNIENSMRIKEVLDHMAFLKKFSYSINTHDVSNRINSKLLLQEDLKRVDKIIEIVILDLKNQKEKIPDLLNLLERFVKNCYAVINKLRKPLKNPKKLSFEQNNKLQGKLRLVSKPPDTGGDY